MAECCECRECAGAADGPLRAEPLVSRLNNKRRQVWGRAGAGTVGDGVNEEEEEQMEKGDERKS